MRALVTGATGFLGQHLTSALLARGAVVTATGRNREQGAALASRGAAFLAADLADVAAIAPMIAGHDVVFHCAALASPWGPYEAFERANVTATRNVVRACLAGGVRRLVHVSTPSIYIEPRDRVGIHEDDPLPKPASAYAATKLLAEREVAAGARRGLETIVLRPQAIFGEGDTAVVPRILRANAERGVPFFGGGRALIDTTYIDDAVEALLRAAEAPRDALGKAFNVTSGSPRTFAELFGAIFASMGVPLRKRVIPFRVAYGLAFALEALGRARGVEPPLTRYAVTVLGNSRTLDISRARSVLGYTAKVGVDKGIRRAAPYYRRLAEENGWVRFS